jgi:Cys-tRNA(Pro)/Cys-tRNA(Cys) deacylase
MKKTNAIRILEQKEIDFDTINYTYDCKNLNVEQIAADNNLELDQVYKTLVLKGDKTGLVIALVAGNASLSFKKLAAVSGNKKMGMVGVTDLEKYTGYIRGGCSPIGMKKEYPVFISEEAQELEKMYINAGTRGVLVGLAPIDFSGAVNGLFCELSER